MDTKERKKDTSDEEEILKSVSELKYKGGDQPNLDEDGEWEYSKDFLSKQLATKDENKRKIIEEEIKVKESQKLKEIEVQQKEVNKLHNTFGLESIIQEISDTYNSKDIESLIQFSTKCRFLFELMHDLK